MRFRGTPLKGAFLIELDRHEDERGFFARSYCAREFQERGLVNQWSQTNVAFNHKAGTLRGLHLQIAPNEETKLVRCTRGAVWNVIVDLREESATFEQWYAAELSSENRCQLYIPGRFANGYLTLEKDTELSYQMAGFYAPECSRGFRFDDPRFAISWPAQPQVISERDLGLPLFEGVLR